MSGFQGDPLIKWSGGDGGDIVKNNGDYERNPGIENMINILLGTKRNTWSNVFKTNKIIGMKVSLGDVITLDDIRDIERDAEYALSPLKTLNIANEVTVSASNPSADNILLAITISEKTGKTATYSRTWGVEFG
jgi:phage gp46-like protein